MGIVAGFLVQNTLKYLLKFGQVTRYLGYNALLDFFPTMSMKPNQSCDDSFCRTRQAEYQKRKVAEEAEQLKRKKTEGPKPVKEKKPAEPNKWGIVCVEESEDVEEKTEVAPGIRLAYAAASDKQAPEEPAVSSEAVPETEESLDDLMKQLKSL